MLNPIEVYEDCGRRAAEARNRGDEGSYRHHRAWWAKARALENDSDRKLADTAYDAGWKAVRNVPKPEYFR